MLAAGLACAPAQALDLPAALQACRGRTEMAARLTCYDALADRLPGLEFKGAGNRILPPFDISGPTQLVFESSDVIMVVYLLDDKGRVIQNLHQAGAGSGSFLIAQPGRYGLQINASGGWSIRLETPDRPSQPRVPPLE